MSDLLNNHQPLSQPGCPEAAWLPFPVETLPVGPAPRGRRTELDPISNQYAADGVTFALLGLPAGLPIICTEGQPNVVRVSRVPERRTNPGNRSGRP